MGVVRERERRDLVERARATTASPDRVILLTGEAGIGKTHLAREVVAQLAAEGFGVAWGRADPVERAVPYAAIAQVLASLSAEATAPTWGTNGGADAVLHEVYRPVASLLETKCADGPLVVAIDDLHYADEDTLALIGFLVRRLVNLPVVWLFTCRPHVAEPTPGLAQLLHRLTEDRRLEEVTLDRLASGDVARVVADTVGPVDEIMMTSIVERAAGNPFFAIQLGLSLAETDTSSRAVPSVSRRGALLERVFPLGDAARSVARFASVRGAVHLDELDGLAPALHLDADELQAGFDRLVRAALLRVDADGRYEFVHDLVRETLYDDVGPAERRRLHGLAAQSLLERRAKGEDVDAVELAHHLSLGSLGADARAADALREAGDALVLSSPRSAALRYRQALGYLGDDGAGTTELHVRLAAALRRAGDPIQVVQVCRHGLAAAGDGESRDRLTRYLATGLADTGSLRDAVDLLDAELTRSGPSAVLLSTRSALLRLLDDYEGSHRAIEEAAAAVHTGAEALAVLFERLNLAVDLGTGGPGQAALSELERLIPTLDPSTQL
ncbi:MAG TPA: AAA family ATPase, partial [Acidimicrobiales bacterium]